MKIQQHRSQSRQQWLKKPMLSGLYRKWLIDDGSLTARLKARYADFAVKPVLLKNARAFSDESALLCLKANEYALIREVLLMGNGQPVVFAHSVLPRGSLRGKWRGLGRLGNQPLGAALFANPKVRRTPLAFKKLSPHHVLYQHAIAHTQAKPAYLWARRSVFSLYSASQQNTVNKKYAKILVTEVFLPTLLKETA